MLQLNFVTVLIFACLQTVQAVNLVVPNANALVEGVYKNVYPLNNSGDPMHYQQIYDSSEFALLGTNGGTISYIAFRCHDYQNTGPRDYPMTVRVGISPRTTSTLSSTFSDNLGSNSIVFSGTFSLTTFAPWPGYVGQHPWPFPVVIPFGTPYFYNPTNGNLILDIQMGYWGRTDGPDLDNLIPANHSIARVWSQAVVYNGAPPATGNKDSEGSVTEFGVTPVVQPIPRFTSISFSGTNLVATGMSGAPGLVHCVLSAPDATLPLTNWANVATNAFDSNGNFAFTNGIDASVAQLFYRLQIQ